MIGVEPREDLMPDRHDAPDDPCARAVASLGPPPWSDERVRESVAALFSRHRAAFDGASYLANHSLGRPLDATADDVAEGLDAWYASMGGAWEAWEREERGHRARIARLLGAARDDAVVPKTSAGAGLRAVLSSFDAPPRVVATGGEFDSLDLILREWSRRGALSLRSLPLRPPQPGARDARALPHLDSADLLAAIEPGVDLVVVSEVLFQTGQRVDGLPDIVARAHAVGAKVLVDVYHSLGAMPVDIAALDADFAVGGGYKYLRGGPGACFLYVAPRWLDADLRTLDTGWFAKRARFDYQRPDPPLFAQGGDGWLESTPPVLAPFQARAGLALVQALGPAAIRVDSLARQARLVDAFAARGVRALGGGDDRGAFVVVPFADSPEQPASRAAAALAPQGIVTDARGPCLRFGPDFLTTDGEIARAAEALAGVVEGTAR